MGGPGKRGASWKVKRGERKGKDNKMGRKSVRMKGYKKQMREAKNQTGGMARTRKNNRQSDHQSETVHREVEIMQLDDLLFQQKYF